MVSPEPQAVKVAQTVNNMEHIAKSLFIQIISFFQIGCGAIFHNVFLLFTHFPRLSTSDSTFPPSKKLDFTLLSTFSTDFSTGEHFIPQVIQQRVENF